MTNALVITRNWSDEPENANHGVFQRFSLFLDAISSVVKSIDILTFVPNGPDVANLAERHRVKYQRGREAQIKIIPIIRDPNPENWRIFDRYLLPSLSIDRQEDYINIANNLHVQSIIKALNRKPDFIFAHRLAVFTPLLKSLGDDHPPIFFDMDDIEHRALIRGVIHAPRWISDRLRMLHVPALILREREAVRVSSRTFVCSKSDQTALAKLAGCNSVLVIPNSVNVPKNILRHECNKVVGFIGSFQHPPNIDGAFWLLNEIWPRVIAREPFARLLIAGSGSKNLFSQFDGVNGVEILDFIPMVDDFYNQIDLVLSPLRFGAGTRVKIIEASGYGVPCISTSIGAEGLEHQDGIDICIRNDVEDIVYAVVDLINSPERVKKIGALARDCYFKNYSRERIVDMIKDCLLQK